MKLDLRDEVKVTLVDCIMYIVADYIVKFLKDSN